MRKKREAYIWTEVGSLKLTMHQWQGGVCRGEEVEHCGAVGGKYCSITKIQKFSYRYDFSCHASNS